MIVRRRYYNLAEERKHPRKKRKKNSSFHKPNKTPHLSQLRYISSTLQKMQATAVYNQEEHAWLIGPIGKLSSLHPSPSSISYRFHSPTPDYSVLYLRLKCLNLRHRSPKKS